MGSNFIGIISDSHGDINILKSAVINLKKKCSSIFHLGDICQSYKYDNIDECINILIKNNVNAIKGNNDHSIIVNINDNHKNRVNKNSISYIKSLPLVIYDNNYIFTHSLPFDKYLGLSCMIRTMDNQMAKLFFENYPDKILFRGHSHKPEIMVNENGTIIKKLISNGNVINLNTFQSCIITCGALSEGFYLLLDTIKNECVFQRALWKN